MHDPSRFDDLYASTRARLLLQAYALTGDLPAARGAVRDAFISTWHRWRKVSRLADPEAWIRPHAWNHAQRRHTGRIWHRDKHLDEESRATLDALSKLTLTQRKALLLVHLSDSTPEQMAREIGLTDQSARRELAVATTLFVHERDTTEAAIGGHLRGLGRNLDETRFPRATIIRRRGIARRRAHTTVGIATCLGVLLGAGAFVHHTGGSAPALGGGVPAVARKADPDPGEDTSQVPTTHLDVAELLAPGEVAASFRGRKVGSTTTSDNTTGTGIHTACQRDRFADRSGLAALVRIFPILGQPSAEVVQSVELSASESAAEKAFDRAVGWYSTCEVDRAQLISAHLLEQVGDEGMVLALHTWTKPVKTWQVSVVRTGNLVTTLSQQVSSRTRPQVSPWVDLTTAALAKQCRHEAAGACPGADPRAVRVAPPPAPDSPGMLQVIDLPPIPGVAAPWAATDPVPARTNAAATVCDKANFTGKAVKESWTRSFVIPGAKLPSAFGLTQTLGRFASPGPAGRFMDMLEERLATCEDDDPAAEVTKVDRGSGDSGEWRIWRVSVEIAEDRQVHFEMALVRNGRYVVQLGFVRDGDKGLSDTDMRELILRASARLVNIQD